MTSKSQRPFFLASIVTMGATLILGQVATAQTALAQQEHPQETTSGCRIFKVKSGNSRGVAYSSGENELITVDLALTPQTAAPAPTGANLVGVLSSDSTLDSVPAKVTQRDGFAHLARLALEDGDIPGLEACATVAPRASMTVSVRSFDQNSNPVSYPALIQKVGGPSAQFAESAMILQYLGNAPKSVLPGSAVFAKNGELVGLIPIAYSPQFAIAAADFAKQLDPNLKRRFMVEADGSIVFDGMRLVRAEQPSQKREDGGPYVIARKIAEDLPPTVASLFAAGDNVLYIRKIDKQAVAGISDVITALSHCSAEAGHGCLPSDFWATWLPEQGKVTPVTRAIRALVDFRFLLHSFGTSATVTEEHDRELAQLTTRLRQVYEKSPTGHAVAGSADELMGIFKAWGMLNPDDSLEGVVSRARGEIESKVSNYGQFAESVKMRLYEAATTNY